MRFAKFRVHHPIGGLRDFIKALLAITLTEDWFVFTTIHTLKAHKLERYLLSDELVHQHKIAFHWQVIPYGVSPFGKHFLKYSLKHSFNREMRGQRYKKSRNTTSKTISKQSKHTKLRVNVRSIYNSDLQFLFTVYFCKICARLFVAKLPFSLSANAFLIAHTYLMKEKTDYSRNRRYNSVIFYTSKER